jgi:Resolvase, N terminal domain
VPDSDCFDCEGLGKGDGAMMKHEFYAAQFSRHNQQRRAPQREFSVISGETFERCRTIRRAASVAAGSSLRMLAASAFTKRMLPGGRWDRPELHKALEHLRRGDVLICWKLDRLS